MLALAVLVALNGASVISSCECSWGFPRRGYSTSPLSIEDPDLNDGWTCTQFVGEDDYHHFECACRCWQPGTQMTGSPVIPKAPPVMMNEARAGSSLAADGLYVVTGAPNYGDPGKAAQEGAVWIYYCSSLPCSEVATLTAAAHKSWAWLGTSVAISGSVVVAGAPGWNGAGELYSAGAVFVWDCTDGNCQTGGPLIGTKASAFLGTSVGVDSSTGLVVGGAPECDDEGKSNVGAVYIWKCTDPLSCTPAVGSPIFGGTERAYLGRSVAVSSWIVVAGAYNYSYSDEMVGMGCLFMYKCPNFECSPISGSLTTYTAHTNLGYSVAMSGDLVVAGAIGASSNNGAIYVWNCSMIAPSFEVVNCAQIGVQSGKGGLGESVAIDGNLWAGGGSYYHENGGPSGGGGVYAFSNSKYGVMSKAGFPRGGLHQDDWLGRSIAVSGRMIYAGASGLGSGGFYIYYV